jgi:hypothetical protein
MLENTMDDGTILLFEEANVPSRTGNGQWALIVHMFEYTTVNSNRLYKSHKSKWETLLHKKAKY